MTDSPEIPKRSVHAVETRREKWIIFITFLGFSVLEVWVLIYGNLTFESWRDWIFVGGAIFFPVLTAISWKSLLSNWSIEESDRAIGRVLGWIIAIPFIVGAIVLAAWVLFNFFGWVATIPAWAAVIIILLLFRR